MRRRTTDRRPCLSPKIDPGCADSYAGVLRRARRTAQRARVIVSVIAVAAMLVPGAARADPFAMPQELAPDVAFWARIYAEVPSNEGLVHDDRRLDVVYAHVTVPSRDMPEERRRVVAERRAEYADRLRRLAADGTPRDAVDVRIIALWPGASRDDLLAAAGRVRFQSGQADRFLEGLRRSGAWRDWIAATFAERGLPAELAALPHVESSFHPGARSKAGAAGLWQFMSATGREYLRVDDVVDERLDPMRSTEAAANYLDRAHALLGSWPLAVLSYNHGMNGVARAVASLGTTDVVRLLREYSSPTFGFASRNFYPSFLAAVRVERDAPRLFPAHAPDPPWRTCTIPLRSAVPPHEVARKFGLTSAELAILNPALRDTVWARGRPMPAGYRVRVPLDARADPARHYLMDWPRARPEVARLTLVHTVAAGETLSAIAARHGTTAAALAGLNGVRDPRRLRIGQSLVLRSGASAVCGGSAAPVLTG